MYRYVWLCVCDEKKEVNWFPDLKAFEKSAWLLLTTQFCVFSGSKEWLNLVFFRVASVW